MCDLNQQNMKQLLMILSFGLIVTPSVLRAQKCYDYTCNMDKARTALGKKQFKEALAYCKAAKAYSNANAVEADALIDKVFEGIEAQKKIAEDATKRAETETKKAQLAKEEALTQAGIAQKEKDKAIIATHQAEKTARAAENSAVFLRTLNSNPALALRMMYYNYTRHPENTMTRNYYKEIIKDPKTVFVSQVLRSRSGIHAVALSPDGKKVFAANRDKNVIVFDLASGRVDKTFPIESRSSRIKELIVSPDGKKLLSIGGVDTIARLWDIASGRLEHTFAGRGYGINTAAFSPDGKKLLTGDSEETALWDIETEKKEKTYLSFTNVVAFSLDGKKALIGTKNAILWQLETGQVERIFKLDDTQSYLEVKAVCFSPDGKKALVSGLPYPKLWDIASGQVEKIFIQDGRPNKVYFSPDGTKVLMTYRGQSKLWDIKTGEVEKTIPCEGVAFLPDGHSVLAKDYSCVKVCDLDADKAEKTFSLGEEVRSVAFSPDGKKILTGGGQPNGPSFGNNNMVKLWDAASGKLDKTFLGHTHYVQAVIFAPDDNKIWSADHAKVKRWDINSGLQERSLVQEAKNEDYFNKTRFSHDREKVLFKGEDNIRVWNLKTEQFEQSYTVQDNVIAFSPNGKKVLVSQYVGDSFAELQDVATGKVEQVFIGQTGGVNVAVFSPDGKKILTGSGDNTAKLWDIETGIAEKTFIGHTSEIFAVAFSPDGKKILTGSRDKTAKLWDIEAHSIEGWTFPYSLYEMVFEGLTLEPQDTPQYVKDSIELKDYIFREPEIWVSDYAPISYINDDETASDSTARIEDTVLREQPIDVVEDLQNQIDGTEDSLKIYQLYTTLIDTLKNRMKLSPEQNTALLVEAYANRAWAGLFLKKYEESEADIQAGIRLDKDAKSMYVALAPILLLQGKFDKAKAEYEKWQNKSLYLWDYTTYKEAFLDDLNTLEAAGIIPKEREKDVATIKKLLEKKY